MHGGFDVPSNGHLTLPSQWNIFPLTASTTHADRHGECCEHVSCLLGQAAQNERGRDWLGMLRSVLQFHQPLHRGVGPQVSPIVVLFVEESANSLSCVGERGLGRKGLSLSRQFVSFLLSEPGKTQATRQTWGWSMELEHSEWLFAGEVDIGRE